MVIKVAKGEQHSVNFSLLAKTSKIEGCRVYASLRPFNIHRLGRGVGRF